MDELLDKVMTRNEEGSGTLPLPLLYSATDETPPPQLEAQYSRDLTEADLVLLQARRLGVEPEPLKNIRYSHHKLARLIVDGKKDVECATITGYSTTRISILKRDPAFKELLNYYAGQVEQVFVDQQERLRNLSVDSMELLQERINETPDEIDTSLLCDIIKMTSDRSGAGPTSKLDARMLVGVVDETTLHKIKSIVDERQKGNVKKEALLVEVQPSEGEGEMGEGCEATVVHTREIEGGSAEGDKIPE